MLKINDILNITEGIKIGDTDIDIISLNRIEYAKKGELTFYVNEKYKDYLLKSDATCIIIPYDLEILPKENQIFIKCENPYQSFIKLLIFLNGKIVKEYGKIHHSVIIEDECLIDDTVSIGPNSVIGKNTKIAKYTIIKSNVTIDENVVIGQNCLIYPNVSIYKDCVIGDNCIIHSGAVIGSDGFGYIESENKSFTKIPQLGNVIIESDVEVGANTTIDRALVGSTFIRKGTKIDNLVHIAHNCDIGQNSGIAAQTGISGSVKIGENARIGGQVGIAGHLEIKDNVTLLAQSGVSKSILHSGVYFGSPAKDIKTAFKIESIIRNLPEIYELFKKIKQDFSNH